MRRNGTMRCLTLVAIGLVGPVVPSAVAAEVAQAGVAGDSARLTLEEAVRRSLAGHPVITAASAEVDRSVAGLSEARSARWPRLHVEGAGTRFEEPMIVAPLHGFDPQAPPDFDRFLVQGRAVASYTVFDGGTRDARVMGARAATEEADAGLDGASAGLIERVVRAYIGVGASREIVAANDSRVAALREERSRADRMLVAGSVPQVAVLRAEAALAGALADRAAAVADLRHAEADLARLIGTGADSVAILSLEVVVVSDGVPGPDRAALIALAAERNPAVVRARAQQAAAEAVVEGARAAFWPVVALNGGYAAFGSGAGDYVGEWQAALQISYAVFDGGARGAAVERNRAGVQAASARLARARLDAAAEVDAGLAGLAGARARVEALGTAVDQFVAVADIEALSLAAGAGVQPDYLRAVSDLLDARASLTRARAAEVSARVTLARITGELGPAWLIRNLEVQ